MCRDFAKFENGDRRHNPHAHDSGASHYLLACARLGVIHSVSSAVFSGEHAASGPPIPAVAPDLRRRLPP